MVLRKPAPEENLVPAPLSQAANNPPYPTTPSEERPSFIPSASERETVYSPDLNKSPAFDLKTVEDVQKKKKEDDDNDSEYSLSDWDKSDDEDSGPEDLPGPLKIGGGKPLPPSANKSNALPDALRAGPPAGVPVKQKSAELISPEPTGASASSYGGPSNASEGSIPLQTNNPYLKMQMTGQSNFGAESSQQVWGDDRVNTLGNNGTAQGYAQNYGELVELPSFNTPDTPTHGMANMNLNGNASQQDAIKKTEEQPPLIAVELPTPQSAHPRHDSSASEAWNPGADISSLDAFARGYGLPTDEAQPSNHQTWQEQQSWEQNERDRKQRELHAAREAAEKAEQERRHEEEFHRGEQQASATYTPQTPSPYEEQAPALPPRRSQEEQPPAMPPRPLQTGIIGSSTTLGPESPNTAMNRQRKEHYQIKHIRWHDVNKSGIRSSPILTQNVNGPCPLLALVNALVLSTPSGIETALVETLRTREQVSLGLLLDAVFDELMSGRRGGAAQELPDVGELYKFLLALHTGLNINPMFVPDSDATDGIAVLNSSQARQPGVFENTRDMKLYRTFNIPLMHGWLPERGSDAYQAFERIAKSYETSQYVQFQEEELDAKLQSGESLTTDEQQMFTDIHAIKEFLNKWPTQLTDYGLKTMRETLQPGQVAILFRNDHFSTLYKDPRTDRLVTLVTDQGYSSHDEIVWESLVDVNGQGSELFSGDFRPVGNNSTPQRPQNQQPVQSLLDVDDNQGWTTVQSRRGHTQQNSTSSANAASPTSEFSRTEQEDHDLALALQLQEEEDDRHRRSVEERRRRENQLSENAISAQAQQRPSNNRVSRPGETPPVIPPRRNNIQTHRPNNEPAPPPTYEEAATNPPYNPPQGHPANPSAPIPQPGSAYRMNSSQISSGPGGRRPSGQPIRVQNMQNMQGRPGRRHSAGVVGPNSHEDRDKCIIM